MSLPPYKIETWTDNNATLHCMTMSLAAAEPAFREAVAKMQTGQIVRVVDVRGEILMSSEPSEVSSG